MKTLAGPAGGAASSLAIVPVATASPSVAPPCGADSSTVKVSSASNAVSPATGRRMVALAWPAANETMPFPTKPGAKSAADAWPPPVPNATE